MAVAQSIWMVRATVDHRQRCIHTCSSAIAHRHTTVGCAQLALCACVSGQCCVLLCRYASLRTNLPRALMTFIDFPFIPAATAGRSSDPRMYPLHTEVRMWPFNLWCCMCVRGGICGASCTSCRSCGSSTDPRMYPLHTEVGMHSHIRGNCKINLSFSVSCCPVCELCGCALRWACMALTYGVCLCVPCNCACLELARCNFCKPCGCCCCCYCDACFDSCCNQHMQVQLSSKQRY